MTTKTYEALAGVEWVNGSPVPESRQIALSEAEARFDLDHERIRPSSDADSDADEDGDDAPLAQAEPDGSLVLLPAPSVED